MFSEFYCAGTYHEQHGKPAEDFVCTAQKRTFSVIALADGVSSCEKAKEGAKIAASALTALLLKHAEHFFELDCKESRALLFEQIRFELKRCADAEQRSIGAYSSTLSGILLDQKKHKIFLFHLGDGLALAAGAGSVRVLAAPTNSVEGCCVTTTENAEHMTRVRLLDGDVGSELFLFSDGAWRLLYEKTHLRPEAQQLLLSGQTEELKRFFQQKKSTDDCSFVSVRIL